MTTNANEFTTMLDALKTSVIQIADRPSEERETLLAKSFGEFADAWTKATEAEVEAIAQESFMAGVQDGFAGLGKGEDAVLDGLTRLGAVLSMAGATVNELGESLGKGEHVDALVDWANAGQTIAESLGLTIDRALAKAEGGDELAKAEAEKLAKSRESLKKRLEALAKMDDEGAEIDGLEAVARLLAAALAQIDELQNAHEGMEEGEADGNEEEYERSEKSGDLKKSEGEKAEGEKVEKAEDADIKAKLAKLEKENAELRKNAEAPKGALRAVDKAGDSALAKGESADAKLLAEAERLSKMSPEELSRELIKISQRTTAHKIV